MPNHITTKIEIRADEETLKAIHTLVTPDNNEEEEDDCVIDFAKIIPFPKELENTTSPTRIITQEEYDEQEKKIANGENVFSRGITQDMADKFIEKYGSTDWHTWNCKNWGTKWNSYNGSVNDDLTMYEIQTAWSYPEPIIGKLAEMFPSATIIAVFADEDFGYNYGYSRYESGELVDEMYNSLEEPENYAFCQYVVGWALDAESYEDNTDKFTDIKCAMETSSNPYITYVRDTYPCDIFEFDGEV